MLLQSICLFLLALGTMLVLIWALLNPTFWLVAIAILWMSASLWESLKKRSYQLLKKWSNIFKPEAVMVITTEPDFSKMSKIQKYQHFTRRKLQQVENIYYPMIDELKLKLIDLGEVPAKFIPDFTLFTFSFIKEWQSGLVNTEFVLALLKSMSFESVAEKQLTRRLTNFIHDKASSCPKTCDYVQEVRKQLLEKAVPLYVSYLQMLTSYFQKMYEIDQLQVKVTWLEQIWHGNGEVRSSVRDMSLNQVYRDLMSNVAPNNSHKYFVGKNLVVFDEELTDKDAAIHWLFAPQSYIEQLKKSFEIVEEMSMHEEKAYIQKIIGDYTK